MAKTRFRASFAIAVVAFAFAALPACASGDITVVYRVVQREEIDKTRIEDIVKIGEKESREIRGWIAIDRGLIAEKEEILPGLEKRLATAEGDEKTRLLLLVLDTELELRDLRYEVEEFEKQAALIERRVEEYRAVLKVGYRETSTVSTLRVSGETGFIDSGDTGIICDLDSGRITLLINDARAYAETSLVAFKLNSQMTLKKYAEEDVSSRIRELRLELIMTKDEARKDEIRLEIKKQESIKRFCTENVPIEYVPTGEKKKIAGYPAEELRIMIDRKEHGLVWISNDESLLEAAEFMDEFFLRAGLRQFTMEDPSAPAFRLGLLLGAEYTQYIPGVPGARKIVESVSFEKLDENIFKVPEGYREDPNIFPDAD